MENIIDPTVGEWFWLCNAWETAVRQSRMDIMWYFIDALKGPYGYVDWPLQTIQMYKL